MSTWCCIGKMERDGGGRYVLLTHDGNPKWAGRKLLEHYSDAQAIDELIALGDLKTLGDSPDQVPGANAGTGENPYLWHITRSYRRDGQVPVQGALDWEPRATEGGTDGLFEVAARRTPAQWAYAWTPDGWLACYVAVIHRTEGLMGITVPLASLIEAGCMTPECACAEGRTDWLCRYIRPEANDDDDENLIIND